MFLLAMLAGLAQVQAAELSSGKELKFNPKYPPAPLYSDLLNALQSQVMWKDGKIAIHDKIRALFLPEFNDPQHSYAYNTQTGARLAHQVKGPDGKVIATTFYHASKLKAPFWAMHAQPAEDHKLSEGKHEIVWYLEGKEFYKFPFTVRVIGGEDPYNPGGKYVFDGPWSDFIYLYFPNRNPNATGTISLWTRDENAAPGRWSNPKVVIKVTRDGKYIGGWPGVEGANNTLTLKPWWIRSDIGLRKESGALPVKEMTQDGTYEITITMDGKPYGTYEYTAKGGKFQEQDRQVRKDTDPMLFIEGGGERFFVKKK